MDHHPYLRLTKGKLTTHTTTYTIRTLTKRLTANQPLYLLDDDGITANRPNYNTYQRLSTHADLWIDAGPRSLDDAIDLIMAGATTLVIRPSLWPTLDTTDILAITDCPLYIYYDHPDTPTPPYATGLIIPNTTPPAFLPLSLIHLPRYLLALDSTIPLPDDPAYTGAFLDLSPVPSPEEP